MSNVTAWTIVLPDVAALVGAGVAGVGVGLSDPLELSLELALELALELSEAELELESEEYRLIAGLSMASVFWTLRRTMCVTRVQ